MDCKQSLTQSWAFFVPFALMPEVAGANGKRPREISAEQSDYQTGRPCQAGVLVPAVRESQAPGFY